MKKSIIKNIGKFSLIWLFTIVKQTIISRRKLFVKFESKKKKITKYYNIT